MDFHRLCSTFKETIATELRAAEDAAAREEILIEALYELSRSVLPQLGYPTKSDEYLERQGAVLDIITFIAIDLIRCASRRLGVTVLSEVGEGCRDPLLKKKLLIYSQELLAKLTKEAQKASSLTLRRIYGAVAAFAGAIAAVYLAITFSGSAVEPDQHKAVEAEEGTRPPAVAYKAPLSVPVAPPAAGAPTLKEQPEEKPRQSEWVPAEAKVATTPGEQITKVRIVNNQILVPVTLKNGGGAVMVELVLDTGASRTAVHEYLASQLRIDLRTAKLSQAEVADGRIITSKRSKIDSLAVGPYAMAGPEVEIIPYRGTEGLHDGLLGMDFLGKHRYQVDMDREVIRWFQ